ncbi:predicted protein [Naegleria gruberi]|uniref:Predicted protein n=1 Tax=Naegleria gruberi TaxID=5762 RepID=D2VN83_NAEGR|nr:uncharacterized protein NAEGRDRAFT_70404 [Naegleria gruberi]EFC41606.1 predicted protein [Naegleria gruberi]|eukprot:XP_002674350.1 predicted protein [Naegleria gruberi strain NEG-M]
MLVELSDTVNEKGEKVNLRPIKIVIQKSAPKAVYPLLYVKTFNGKPTESIIYKDDILVPTCDDSSKSAAPTCGWVKDSQGNKIPDSQGFCCSCSVGQMFGDSSASNRGALNCGFMQMKSSAHCLRLGEVYWDAYEIEGYVMSFEISVFIGETGFDDIGKVTVSPSSKLAQLPKGGRVELEGDFSAYKSVPLYESKYLFIPSSPKTSPIVVNGQANWMFIDKSMVTLSGSECDKIGVSYAQFRNQPNACSRPALTCLANQIEDLRLADVELMKSGLKSGKYIVSNFGSFAVNKTNTGNVLEKYLDEDTNSQINLYINGENVKFLITKSAAEISEAYVKTFTSLSKEGEMLVSVKNKGANGCSYVVTVTECSDNILTIVQQTVFVDASNKKELTFQVRSEQKLATTNQCKVTLLFSDGEKIQDITVTFDSKDYAYENAMESSGEQTGKVETEGDHSLGQCKCNSPFDVVCIVLNSSSCTSYIIGWVASIVGIIATPVIFVFLWRCGLFGLMFKTCKCCACCCSFLPTSIMNCLIGPYKKKSKKSKKSKKKKRHHSSSDSEDEKKSKKKKKKSKKNKKRRKKRRQQRRDDFEMDYYNDRYSKRRSHKDIEHDPIARYK